MTSRISLAKARVSLRGGWHELELATAIAVDSFLAHLTIISRMTTLEAHPRNTRNMARGTVLAPITQWHPQP